MDRTQFADFLRRARTRLAPADVGLTEGARRRTPGLRREEVAQLAGMSVDYYTRLEQARGPHPSGQLLAALARALRLTEDEHDHLFHLAGQSPPRGTAAIGRHIRPGLLLVLDRLHDTPATVHSDLGDLLAQNRMAVLVFGEVTGGGEWGRNLIWRWFTHPSARDRVPEEDHARLSATHVAQLRATVGARPDDPRGAALVRRLLAASEEFSALWDRHEVAVRREDVKRVRHPQVGMLELDCERLVSGEDGQRLVIHTARPGTETYERLELLRVVGLQDLGRAEQQV
jgi:transcriptional regulator with XRE-family HTH domain